MYCLLCSLSPPYRDGCVCTTVDFAMYDSSLEAWGGRVVGLLVDRSVGRVGGSVGFQGRRNPDPEPGIRDSPEPQQHQGSVSSLFYERSMYYER